MNDITARSEQYRGFTISVTPQKDNDDLWDFTYHLQREGESAGASDHAQPHPGRLCGT